MKSVLQVSEKLNSLVKHMNVWRPNLMQTAKLLKKEIKNKKIGSGNVMLSEPMFFLPTITATVTAVTVFTVAAR
jgi:hypothetical protein